MFSQHHGHPTNVKNLFDIYFYGSGLYLMHFLLINNNDVTGYHCIENIVKRFFSLKLVLVFIFITNKKNVPQYYHVFYDMFKKKVQHCHFKIQKL